jgi:hypothetical protein
MVNAGFDYGDPFEIRSRKPFDFFRFQLELDFGVGRKFLNNITGYGILFGKNSHIGKMPVLSGLFQYFDYWDNNTFELSALGFGGGVFSKLPINNKVNLCTNAHLALMPLAGNSTHFGPDTSQVRNYNFGGGFEGKFESTINFGQAADISLIYYNYMIHTYDGVPGNNFIQILKPRITIRLYKDLRIGFENYIYFSDRSIRDLPSIHSTTTEQKLFLMLSLEDRRRKGHNN